MKELLVHLDSGEELRLDFRSVTNELLANHVTVVQRDREDGGGSLDLGEPVVADDCHYHHYSNHTYAAVSNCDGNLVRKQRRDQIGTNCRKT